MKITRSRDSMSPVRTDSGFPLLKFKFPTKSCTIKKRSQVKPKVENKINKVIKGGQDSKRIANEKREIGLQSRINRELYELRKDFEENIKDKKIYKAQANTTCSPKSSRKTLSGTRKSDRLYVNESLKSSFRKSAQLILSKRNKAAGNDELVNRRNVSPSSFQKLKSPSIARSMSATPAKNPVNDKRERSSIGRLQEPAKPKDQIAASNGRRILRSSPSNDAFDSKNTAGNLSSSVKPSSYKQGSTEKVRSVSNLKRVKYSTHKELKSLPEINLQSIIRRHHKQERLGIRSSKTPEKPANRSTDRPESFSSDEDFTDKLTDVKRNVENRAKNFGGRSQEQPKQEKAADDSTRMCKELRALRQDIEENINDDKASLARILGHFSGNNSSSNGHEHVTGRRSSRLKTSIVNEGSQSTVGRQSQFKNRDFMKMDDNCSNRDKIVDEDNEPLIRRFNKFFIRRISKTYGPQNAISSVKKVDEKININREIDKFFAKKTGSPLPQEIGKPSKMKNKLDQFLKPLVGRSLVSKADMERRKARKISNDNLNRNLKISFMKNLDLVSLSNVSMLNKDSANRRSKRINLSLAAPDNRSSPSDDKTNARKKVKSFLSYTAQNKSNRKRLDRSLVKKYACSAKSKTQKDQLLSKPLIKLTRCNPKRLVQKRYQQLEKDKQLKKGAMSDRRTQRSPTRKIQGGASTSALMSPNYSLLRFDNDTGRLASWSPLFIARRLWPNFLNFNS